VAHVQAARVARLDPAAGSATRVVAPEAASEAVEIMALAARAAEIAGRARQARVCAAVAGASEA
jgi:streptogramin lyase